MLKPPSSKPNASRRRMALLTLAAGSGLGVCVLGGVAWLKARALSPPARVAMPPSDKATELTAAVVASPDDPQPRLRLLQYLLDQKRNHDALDAAREASAAFPKSTAVQAALADALSACGRVTEAIRSLRSLSAHTPGIKLQLARLLIESGDLEGALRVLRSLPALSREDALTAGQLYLDARSPEATATLLQPFAEASARGHLRDTYGLALLLAGRYAAAAQVLTASAQQSSSSAALHLYTGSAQRLSGNLSLLPEAENHLRRAVELEPNDALVHYELGLSRVQLGDPAGALTAMQQAERLTTEFPEIQRDLSRLLEHLKQRLPAVLAQARYLRMLDDAPAAVRKLDPWYAQGPDNTELALALCAALHEAGQIPRATAVLAKIRGRHPDDPEVLWFQFRLETALQQFDRALATLAQLEAKADENAEMLEARAQTLQRLSRYAEAEPLLIKLRDLEPHKAVRHYELGLLLNRWSQLPEAKQQGEAALRKALDLSPAYPEAHFALGELLQTRGAIPEAQRHFRRALDFAPRYTAALRSLGRAYRLTGDKSRAAESFQLLREVQAQLDERVKLELPVQQLRDLPRSRIRLYQYYLRTGDLKPAIRELEILVKTNPDDPEAHRQLYQLYAHARRFQRHWEEREWLRKRGL